MADHSPVSFLIAWFRSALSAIQNGLADAGIKAGKCLLYLGVITKAKVDPDGRLCEEHQ